MAKSSWTAHLCCLQMLPMCSCKRILYHILLIKTEFPLLSQLYPVLYCMQTAMCACVSVCRYVFYVCVFICFSVCVCSWNFSLSCGSRFQSSELGPIFSLTLSLLPFRDRRAIVRFTIQFGENPSARFP